MMKFKYVVINEMNGTYYRYKSVYTSFSSQNLINKLLHCKFLGKDFSKIYSYENENQYFFCSTK